MGPVVDDPLPQSRRCVEWPQGRKFGFEPVVSLIHGTGSSANCSPSLASA